MSFYAEMVPGKESKDAEAGAKHGSYSSIWTDGAVFTVVLYLLGLSYCYVSGATPSASTGAFGCLYYFSSKFVTFSLLRVRHMQTSLEIALISQHPDLLFIDDMFYYWWFLWNFAKALWCFCVEVSTWYCFIGFLHLHFSFALHCPAVGSSIWNIVDPSWLEW